MCRCSMVPCKDSRAPIVRFFPSRATPKPRQARVTSPTFSIVLSVQWRIAPMPRRSDLESILIIGAGPIVIGQACEFDYSGVQACKALREEGYRVVLMNSNPATIMTDPEIADATYIEPITWQVIARIIAKERPDAILPTMGGQTALNCALDLHRKGVLAEYGCELIGASPDAIETAEDRLKFKHAMTKIGLGSARSGIAHSLGQA